MNYLEIAYGSMGIYPISNNGVPITPRQDGWNDALIALGQNKRILKSWFENLTRHRQAAITFWEQQLEFHVERKTKKVTMAFNMNDTFYYACADAEEVTVTELLWLKKIVPLSKGITTQITSRLPMAWAAKKRGIEPISPLIAVWYTEAKNWILKHEAAKVC